MLVTIDDYRLPEAIVPATAEVMKTYRRPEVCPIQSCYTKSRFGVHHISPTPGEDIATLGRGTIRPMMILYR